VRPTRLEIEGFASFRERTVVDFAGAELFALFGPTGAGKSSLIDAMVFALYGSVPRYEHKGLLAPAISQGLTEARVRLDFTAGDKSCTAVRVVQRTKTGATTREARLECNGSTLAGNADELTAETTRLLGLSFEHFTRCVVLPQGAFAEFLHAKPADRQDLLVQLLGLELYDNVRKRAGERAREKEARLSLLTERLERELDTATPEAVEEADERVAELEALLQEIDAARPDLESLSHHHRTAARCAEDADARATLLAGVRLPAGLDALIQRLSGAGNTLAAASTALDEAVRAREEAGSRRMELPERASLDNAARVHAELRTAELTLVAADAERERTAAAAETASAARALADERCEEAESALQAIRREHAAAHLAQHLAVGEPCPVCSRTIEVLPGHAAPPKLEKAVERRDAAVRARTMAEGEAGRALRLASARAAEAASARTHRDRLADAAAGLIPAAEIDVLRERTDVADALLTNARQAETNARTALREAERVVAGLDTERSRAWQGFDDVRDRVAAAGLSPPGALRQDLRAEWDALAAWAADSVRVERDTAARHRTAADRARGEFESRIERQRSRCADHGIQAQAGDPRDACTDALATARESARRIRKDLELATKLRNERAMVEKEGRIAKDLARHLDAGHFERWLMTRALRGLVAGATHVLRELSAGAYSLALDDRNDFLVIDHRNADERRIARTLSGGETFLASLALALALAEHVAELAAGDAARLDAIFLDEGFGTLDADSLEIVATAIEELGSRGRMVGLVTHVRDLAERVPVRFEVRKVAGSSTVERC
jgi:exonuclease SbcC